MNLFKFPAGVNNGDTLYFQPVATKKNDLRMMGLVDDKRRKPFNNHNQRAEKLVKKLESQVS